MKCDSHNLIIVIDEDNDDDVGDDVVKMQMLDEKDEIGESGRH